MCTVTWLAENGGYSLLFNRDERHARGFAEQPRIHDRDRVRFLAPIDTDGGGTWIATNEYGLTLCLLNAYLAAGPRRRTAAESRGTIPIELASSHSLEEVTERIDRTDLVRFAPFRLLALEPDRAAWLFEWSGSTVTVDPNADRRMPLTSSSFESGAVAASRQAVFRNHTSERKALSRDVLEYFHSGHNPAPSAFSVCMHRPDARTVSFSRVTVCLSGVKLDYSADSPCRRKPPTTVCLRRSSLPTRHAPPLS
jgi:hypothetical protein